jgi:hypothetical protein
MSDGAPPYRVVQLTPGCEKCGRGATWQIIGPDDKLVGEVYVGRFDADEMADAMNRAYSAGRKVATC